MLTYPYPNYPIYTKKHSFVSECLRALSHVKLERKRAAGILLICSEDKTIFLMQRSSAVLMTGSWAIPGGSIEKGESPLICALRECFEEMSSVPIPSKKIGEVTNYYPFMTYKTFAYDVSLKFKTMWKPQINSEHSDYDWFSLDKLPENMHPGVVYAIKRLKLK